ncbi:MAG TPA: ABC transporter permease subunit [Clostridia bacterium]|nr:ABC transporter permease subunit [Clostridia bacterium]
MFLPGLAFFLIFHYGPMFGLQIAFKDFSFRKGIGGSAWVGFKHFRVLFNSYYFPVILRNTLGISLYQLAVGFPAPLLLALLLNEVSHSGVKRAMQTITYAPHFLSTTVVVSMVMAFLSPSTGIVNHLIVRLGGQAHYFMIDPKWFKSLYVISGIWQSMGWGSIIYLAALSGVDVQLYEAADMDGATRFQRIVHINLPCVLPTAILLLILDAGKMMNVGFEKVFLMQNDLTLDTSEIVATYVYRKGILGAQYSFSTAVGLFNSVINFALMLAVNQAAKRMSDVSIW